MRKICVPTFLGLLSLASTACLAIGTIPATFNAGNVFIDTLNGQGFSPHVTRNLGPQHSDEAIYGVYYLANLSRLGIFELPRGAFNPGDPNHVPRFTAFRDIVGVPDPSSVGGILHIGPRVYVGLNEPLAGGNFRASVHSIDVGKAFRTPLTSQGGHTLTLPTTISEEITSMTPGLVSPNQDELYVASSKRITADCHAPILQKLLHGDGRSVIRGGFSIAYDPAFHALQNFPQCHTRVGQIRAAEYQRSVQHVAAQLLKAGYRCRETPTAVEQICVYGIVDHGTSASLDTGFGGDGQVVVRAANSTVPLRYFSHVVDAQERVVIGLGVGNPDGTFRPLLVRLNADGTSDSSFGEVQIITSGANTTIRNLSIDLLGNIQASGDTSTASSVRPFVFFYTRTNPLAKQDTYTPQLFEYAFANRPNSALFTHVRNPDGTLTATGASFTNFPNPASMLPLIVKIEGPPVSQPAIQYFHAQFGHYVTVVDPDEQNKLDTGVFQGWSRTGEFFHVYPLGTAGTTDVDRFFSTTFQKSSHFFTANAAESAIVKQNPNWLFEGTVFGVLLPDANGICPTATRPVTRLYNNGLTGAPNHWFGDDPDSIAQRLGQGFVLETSAFLCTE